MKKVELLSLVMIVVAFAFFGCKTSHEIESTHKVESVHEVKPIHIIIDVNLKVDKALDNYFGDLDAAEDNIENKTENTGK